MSLKKHQKFTSERVVLISFIVDILDVVIGIIVTILSGSVVMISQTLEGVADLLATGLLLLGVKRSKRPSTRKHPFGHGRELYFWTFLAALLTFIITAGASFYLGLKRFLYPEPVTNIGLACLVLLVTIFTNGYATSLSLKRLLRKKSISNLWSVFNRSAFIETKTTLVLDVMGTTASILGLVSLVLYVKTGDLRFDGLGAMAIGVTLAILVLFIIKGAKDLLVGQAALPETEEKIIKTAELFPTVEKVLDLRTLHIGTGRLLVNMEVHLINKLTTDEIELLIDNIKNEIKKDVPQATDIQIELETPDI